MYSARPCESQESNAAALSSFRTSMQSGILSNERLTKKKERNQTYQTVHEDARVKFIE